MVAKLSGLVIVSNARESNDESLNRLDTHNLYVVHVLLRFKEVCKQVNKINTVYDTCKLLHFKTLCIYIDAQLTVILGYMLSWHANVPALVHITGLLQFLSDAH